VVGRRCPLADIEQFAKNTAKENAVPVSIPKMPRPTEGALSVLAKTIGRPLPTSYALFVASHDGATPEANTVVISDNEVGVARFIPVSEAPELAAEIDGFPVSAIPFAEDDGGNYFYINPATGCVHFWDHEVEGPDEEVAADAMAFAERLVRFDTSSVALAPGQVRRVWIDPSFKPEF
jgi:hypothetical protein